VSAPTEPSEQAAGDMERLRERAIMQLEQAVWDLATTGYAEGSPKYRAYEAERDAARAALREPASSPAGVPVARRLYFGVEIRNQKYRQDWQLWQWTVPTPGGRWQTADEAEAARAAHWDGCWEARGHHECAIARLRATVGRSIEGWRPIESAPKDGGRVMLTGERGWIVLASWSEDAAFPECEHRPGWQVSECDDCWYSRSLEPAEPTHWMPLPSAPVPGPAPQEKEG
jgi:hypothetical protein